MTELKVLMVGGRRCGKTAALASMFDQITNGIVNNYFMVSDQTVLETKIDPVTHKEEKQDSLIGKSLDLQYFLGTPNSNIFMVDAGPTRNFWDYSLRLQQPGKPNKFMQINFRDLAGEFFVAGGKHFQETQRFIAECDVYVIAIDTPYLMLAEPAINEAVNRVPDIQTFLTNINDNGGKDAKMVIFVPIKCEKWVKEGKIDEVVDRIKQVYNTHITNLSGYEKMSVAIIPIQTAGNILCHELKPAYTLTHMGKTTKCCEVSDGIVRLKDGEVYTIEAGDVINEDSDAALEGTSLVRPYTWYRINPDDSSYKPENCDQLPLHIVQFMLNKCLKLQREANAGGFFAAILRLILNRIRAYFADIDQDFVRNTLDEMRSSNVIKNNQDGITYIKNCF